MNLKDIEFNITTKFIFMDDLVKEKVPLYAINRGGIYRKLVGNNVLDIEAFKDKEIKVIE